MLSETLLFFVIWKNQMNISYKTHCTFNTVSLLPGNNKNSVAEIYKDMHRQMKSQSIICWILEMNCLRKFPAIQWQSIKKKMLINVDFTV